MKKSQAPFWSLAFSLEAPPRFELGVKVLQTSALPLGYGATIWIYESFWKNSIQKGYLSKKLASKGLEASFWIGAEDEIRTRDVHLGKVTLYHWATPAYTLNVIGASGWNRTADTGIFSPLLYRLSYRGIWRLGRGSNPRPPAWQAGILTNWTTEPLILV